MSDRQVTDFLVKVIGRAIKDADFPLAETAIRTLATVNPGAARGRPRHHPGRAEIREMTP